MKMHKGLSARLRFATFLSVIALGSLVSLSPADAQTVLPGTTVGESCTKYKDMPAYPEFISYYQCNNATTVKFVEYYAASGEMFEYIEFRDSFGNLLESRFGRESGIGAPMVPLADSQTP
jgi:hypothetical protein